MKTKTKEWRDFYNKMLSDCVRQLLLNDRPEYITFWQERLEHYKRESRFAEYSEELTCPTS